MVVVLRLRSETVVWSKLGDDVVMLELESSSYFTVRGSGTVIIERLADGATEESLVESVTSRFEVDVDTAKADVARFLKELGDQNMLTTVD
jgi:hypothetical protein